MPNQRGKVRDFRFGAISFEYREREEKDLRERDTGKSEDKFEICVILSKSKSNSTNFLPR